MTIEPGEDRLTSSDRASIARRIRDDTERMLATARQCPDLLELVGILEQTRDEAERVLRDVLHPS